MLGSSVSGVQIPEGVRQALGRRLDRLSEEANALLSTLAVAGREFEHALARELSGHDDATTLALIEEALRARVLEEAALGRYRFMHALMQETLLDELSAARQVLLHGQVAEALERLYGPGDRNWLAAIAEHYRESALLNATHTRSAARYLRLAGEQYAASFAWDEAAHSYEQCLALVAGTSDGLGEDEAALRLALAEALVFSGLRIPGWQQFDDAIARYAERDPLEFARAVLRMRSFQLRFEVVRRLPVIRRAASALGDEPSREACQLLALASAFDLSPEGDVMFERAKAMAEALQLAVSEYPEELRIRLYMVAHERGDFAQAEDIAAQDLAHAVAADADRRSPYMGLCIATAERGEPVRTRKWMREAVDYLAPRSRAIATAWEAFLAWQIWASGEHDTARELLERLPPESVQVRGVKSLIACEAGDLDRALELCPGDDDPRLVLRVHRGLRVRLLLLQGALPDAIEAFKVWQIGFEADRMLNAQIQQLVFLDDALCELADAQTLQRIGRRLDGFPALRAAFQGSVTFDYLRGAIALKLDRVDDAERHFRVGLEWASRPDVRFEVDAGRNLQGLAEVAERRDDHALAMEHLDAAGELFARHGAKLYLDQVIAKKEILKA